jgi:MSHA biogenesis protein MshP
MSRIHQQGFSVVTAIFLIVILAALAVYSVSMFRVQQAGASLDQMSVRALQAAQSGLDFGAFTILNPVALPVCAPPPGPPTVLATLAFPGNSSLGLLRTTVICTRTQHLEAGATVSLYQIIATSCYPAAAGVCPNPAPLGDYVERQIQGAVER